MKTPIEPRPGTIGEFKSSPSATPQPFRVLGLSDHAPECCWAEYDFGTPDASKGLFVWKNDDRHTWPGK